jgi:putative flavoprotein involved in K+ transport
MTSVTSSLGQSDVVSSSASSGAPFDTIVVGGGQAGLAMGYYLKQRGIRFLILEQRHRVGDIWRSRWDSLRLFTPAKYDGLPGMPFPADPHHCPTRDEMADYLEAYAQHFALPVRTGVRVDGVWPAGDHCDGFVVTAGGERYTALQVVVATGAQECPHVPDVAGELDPGIHQLHSSGYRNASQFQDGPVLVVGAGNSGAEIAIEAAREHRTILAGRHPGEEPFTPESRLAPLFTPGLWFAAHHLLTLDTPIGRKFAPAIRSGHAAPRARVKSKDLAAAGVERTLARVEGTRDGLPCLGDGRVEDVANVVWCTGFRNRFGWIHLPVIGADGYPLMERGVVPAVPGLYFIGLPFLYSLSSMLVGGVGRDAAHIAKSIVSRVGSIA